MAPALRGMRKDDLPAASALWNADYPRDRASAERLERIIFGDAHHAPEGALVAEDGGALAGFACCVAPASERGQLSEAAFLKGLCAADWGAGGPAEALLAACEAFGRTRDRRRMQVVEYAAGGHFFPGIPREYPGKVGFFLERGYRERRELHDVEVDLEGFTPGDDQRAALERLAEEGIRITPYRARMLPALRELVEAIQMPAWFPPGWEERYRRGRHTFVALRRDEMLGYANYQPGAERGSFGTTAVRPDRRGRGIGSCLLVASMLKMKQLGTPRVWAYWANTPFYLKNGWRICRRYAALGKEL